MLADWLSLSVISLAMYGAFSLLRSLFRPASPIVRTPAPHPLPTPVVQRRPPPTFSPAVQQQYRDMQIALMQVPDAPDFRRAASFAVQAREVPVSYRQKQYRRFRPVLVTRFTALRQTGVPDEVLMPGLTQLVTALGLADFEADYVRLEAEKHVRRPEPVHRDFGQQLRDAQSNYRDRIRILDEMTDLDEEVKEQLVEQERMKFQETMRELSSREESQHGR